jgi:hypothetical protein
LRQSIDLDDGGPFPDGPQSSSSHLGAILAGIATATSSVFIGRAAELGRLSELLEIAEQGRRAVGVIAGDAGVGKTLLLGELAGRADARGIRGGGGRPPTRPKTTRRAPTSRRLALETFGELGRFPG